MAISFVPPLNNRELAIAIWLLVAIILILSQNKIRKSIFHLIKTFFAWKLTISYVLMLSYISLMLLSLNFLGIWRWTQFTNTVLWIIFVAFVMFFDYYKANDESFFKNAIKDNLRILIVLEFIINLYVFSLWIELLLVPFLLMLGGMIPIAGKDSKYEQVQILINYLLVFVGLFFISYSFYNIVTDLRGFATLENLENFIIPILLSIMFLPFIYFVALVASYENLFTRLRFFIKDNSLLSCVKKKSLLACGLNLWSLNKWSKHINALRFTNEKGVDEAIKVFKRQRHNKKTENSITSG